MVRLDRTGVAAPPDWEAKVLKRFGAMAKEFRRKAKRFERLNLNGSKRRKKFTAYAPHVLPVGKKGKPEFPPLWRRVKAVKAMIATMSDEHCAYCQSGAGADQAGHVEHFRPKSLFPTLAYAIENYFFGCESCNLRKGEKWPAAGEYVRPDAGKPSSRFVFHDDGNVTAVPGDTEAEATVKDFGLHRRGLCKKRRLVIEAHLRAVKAILGRPKLSAATKRKLVRALLVPRLFPYSAAINQSVRRAWETALPSASL